MPGEQYTRRKSTIGSGARKKEADIQNEPRNPWEDPDFYAEAPTDDDPFVSGKKTLSLITPAFNCSATPNRLGHNIYFKLPPPGMRYSACFLEAVATDNGHFEIKRHFINEHGDEETLVSQKVVTSKPLKRDQVIQLFAAWTKSAKAKDSSAEHIVRLPSTQRAELVVDEDQTETVNAQDYPSVKLAS